MVAMGATRHTAKTPLTKTKGPMKGLALLRQALRHSLRALKGCRDGGWECSQEGCWLWPLRACAAAFSPGLGPREESYVSRFSGLERTSTGEEGSHQPQRPSKPIL